MLLLIGMLIYQFQYPEGWGSQALSHRLRIMSLSGHSQTLHITYIENLESLLVLLLEDCHVKHVRDDDVTQRNLSYGPGVRARVLGHLLEEFDDLKLN